VVHKHSANHAPASQAVNAIGTPPNSMRKRMRRSTNPLVAIVAVCVAPAIALLMFMSWR